MARFTFSIAQNNNYEKSFFSILYNSGHIPFDYKNFFLLGKLFSWKKTFESLDWKPFQLKMPIFAGFKATLYKGGGALSNVLYRSCDDDSANLLFAVANVLTKQSRVARFFLVQYTKAVKTYTK
jgi:hypothetical protein